MNRGHKVNPELNEATLRDSDRINRCETMPTQISSPNEDNDSKPQSHNPSSSGSRKSSLSSEKSKGRGSPNEDEDSKPHPQKLTVGGSRRSSLSSEQSKGRGSLKEDEVSKPHPQKQTSGGSRRSSLFSEDRKTPNSGRNSLIGDDRIPNASYENDLTSIVELDTNDAENEPLQRTSLNASAAFVAQPSLNRQHQSVVSFRANDDIALLIRNHQASNMSVFRDKGSKQCLTDSKMALTRLSLLQPRTRDSVLSSSLDRSPSHMRANNASSMLRQLTKQRIYQETEAVRQRAMMQLGERPMHIAEMVEEEKMKQCQSISDIDEEENWLDLRLRIRRHFGIWKLFAYDFQIWWSKRKRYKIINAEYRLFLKQIRTVEGRFGSGVVSFFVFLRWIIEMNLLLTVLWTTLVVIPNALFFDRSIIVKMNSTDNLYLRNLLDGGLYFKHSTLFYGGYSDNAKGYPVALMYLICIIVTYFGGFIMVLHSIANALQEEGDAKSGKQYPFTSLLFTSWDYSLKSTSGSENLSKGIGQSIRDFIMETDARKFQESMSNQQKCAVLLRRVLAWTISLFLLIAGSASIFILISRDLVAEFKAFGLNVDKESTIVVYTPSLVFVIINVFIPQILFWLPELEDYHHGKTELYVSISRVFLLRMINLIALLVSLHIKIEEGNFDGCAGTLIGQELYRLIVLDTFVQMFMLSVPKFALFYWTRDPDEFQMPPLILKLLYRMSLIWISTIVSPLSPMLGTVSMIILFMSAYLMVNKTCKPPSKRWNQPRSSSFFMGLTAATLSVIIVIVSMLVTRSDIIRIGQVGHNPLDSCGPFGNDTMLAIYSRWRDHLKYTKNDLYVFLEILTSSSVIAPLIFILFAVIYFQSIQIKFERKRKDEMCRDLIAGQQMERNLIKRLGWGLVAEQDVGTAEKSGLMAKL